MSSLSTRLASPTLSGRIGNGIRQGVEIAIAMRFSGRKWVAGDTSAWLSLAQETFKLEVAGARPASGSFKRSMGRLIGRC
jgi:hypothetical protein